MGPSSENSRIAVVSRGNSALSISVCGREVISNSDMTDSQESRHEWRSKLIFWATWLKFSSSRNEAMSYRDKLDHAGETNVTTRRSTCPPSGLVPAVPGRVEKRHDKGGMSSECDGCRRATRRQSQNLPGRATSKKRGSQRLPLFRDE